MREPAPPPAAPGAHSAPTIAIYTLDDLLTDLDNNLAELEASCPFEALTPMEVETALLRALSQQVATILARERLLARIDHPDPAFQDAVADLDILIARTASQIATLRQFRRLDKLTPAQRQTILARTAAIHARLLAGRARLCSEEAQRSARAARAQQQARQPALQAIHDVDADLAEYDRQLARFLGLSSVPAGFSPQPRPRNTAASVADAAAPTSAGASVDRASVHESVSPAAPALSGTMAQWQSGAAPADPEAPAQVPKQATTNRLPLHPDVQQRTTITSAAGKQSKKQQKKAAKKRRKR